MANLVRIHRHPSLIVAEKVLKKLNKLKVRLYDNLADVLSFNNGREQGFQIRVINHNVSDGFMYVAFAENRNSDDIVVYTSPFSDFACLTNEDERKVKRLFFKPGRYDLAAMNIARIIEDFAKRTK